MSFTLLPAVAPWLVPVDEGQACGPDLEYDPEYLELTQALGKPGSQFGPGEPADWARVSELAESLFTRTRDLRIALWWGRARLNLNGFAALPAVLALFHGLLERFWDELHPVPDADDPDALARLSVIGGLDKLDSLLGDVRNAQLSDDARLDGLRVRDVEVALSKLTARADETPRTQGQIAGVLAAAPEVSAVLGDQMRAALDTLAHIQKSMNDSFNVDLAALRGMLASLASVLPERPVDEAVAVEGDSAGFAPPSRPTGGVHSVETRHDAVRAIELVCAYLERHEPTNPAQLLMRRAARVIDMNFLQLVRELAPDAVKEVSRIMGVDPSTVNDQN